MNNLIKICVSPSTLKQYQNAWKHFSKFVTDQTNSPLTLPIPCNTVGLYVTHLHLAGLQPSTIQGHLTAISFFHKLQEKRDPTQSFLVTKLLVSLNKLSPSADKRLPVTCVLLKQMINCITRVCHNEYDVAMFSAMLSFAYYACLRVGEYAISGNPDNVLQIDQITKISRNEKECAIRVYFNKYKHSTSDHPVIDLKAVDDSTCPVTLMCQYMTHRPNKQGPIFINSSGIPVSRYLFQSVFNKCITLLSLEVRRYNTHSLRIGRSTDMMLQGYSNAQIRSAGRWKSDAFWKYIRPMIMRF